MISSPKLAAGHPALIAMYGINAMDSKIVYHEIVYVKNCSQVVLVSMKQFYHYWPFFSVDYSRLTVSGFQAFVAIFHGIILPGTYMLGCLPTSIYGAE